MLSATLISDDNAHHQIRHRARHGLRGGVAFATSRFAPVVPCSAVLLPESTRGDGGSPNPSGASAAPPASSTAPVHHSLRRRCIHTASFHSLSSSSQSSHPQNRLRRSTRGKRNPAHRPLTPSAFQAVCRSRKTASEALPGDRPRCCLCPTPDRDRSQHSADDSPFLSPSRNPIRYAPAFHPQAFQLLHCRLRRQRSTSNACPNS